MLRRWAIVLSILSLVVVGNARGDVRYTVTDLGALPQPNCMYGGVMAINASGQMVGFYADVDTGYSHGFLYSGGSITELTLDGKIATCAFGINTNGQIAGYASGGGSITAFLYNNGTMTDLGALTGYQNSYVGNLGSNQWMGSYINDKGWVVGSMYNTGQQYAFLYRNGTITNLGNLPNNQYCEGHAVNNNGQVVGDAYNQNTSGRYRRGFLSSNGTMTDLGTPGSQEFTSATALNDNGWVVGYTRSEVNDPFHAFLYRDGTMTNLGMPPDFLCSYATSINTNGQVVGFGWKDQIDYALLFENGTVNTLNSLISPTSGWQLHSAKSIDDMGRIVGYGTIAGTSHAFLLTPIPEPSTTVLLGIGTISLLGYAWRRQRVI